MAKRRPLSDVASRALAPLAREQVIARIVCGEVAVGGARVRDPRQLVDEEAPVTLVPGPRYVSRAGLKLEHAVSAWALPIAGKAFIDAGCSTGGFTDCLLQHGASRVYAVDVGRNQLAFRLRTDARVVVLERTNVMDLIRLPHPAQAAVADLSFRSLRGAAAHLLSLTEEGWLVALAKPQFEWRRPEAGFDGVVRDTGLLPRLLEPLVRDLWREGALLARAALSPLKGRRGNAEMLFELRRGGVAWDVEEAVRRLHEALDGLLA